MMKYDDEILIGYLEGTLDKKTMAEVKDWVEKDPKGRERLKQFRTLLETMEGSVRFDPDPGLDWEFRAALRRSTGSDSMWAGGMRIAAAVALLVVGFSAGTLLKTNGSGDLAVLEQQISDLQQIVVQQKLRDYSPSERLQAVSQIEEIQVSPSEELINTLISTMGQDQSPNVRYAAVQALGKYMHVERVRQALVRSLDKQEDALIQIAIINLLVEADEKAAISPMKKIIEKETTSDEVVRQAQIAIDILI